MNKTFYRSVLDMASHVYDDRSLGGCCAPSATRAISVLYVDQHSQLINAIVPDVVVDDCECV